MSHEQKEHDCTPRLRFPEFRKATKWENVILGDICTFFKGKGISKDEISQDGKIPCIRYGELYTHYSETINFIYSYTNIDRNNLFFSKKNDILIPSSGETKEDIATASCLLLDNIALGSDLHVLRVDQNQIFISYYINHGIKDDISKVAQGDTVVHLYSNQLKNIKLCLPLLQEQQKIADCLTSLDDLITAHEQKRDALAQHKKGLMQRLFPAEGETTPRWRFPEFREAGEWGACCLKEVAEVLSGYAFPAKYQGQKTGKYPFYKVSDISAAQKKGMYISEAENYVDEDVIGRIKAKFIPQCVIIFARIGEAIRLNRRSITSQKCIVDNNVAGIKSRDGIINYLFLYYTLCLVNIQEYASGVVPAVNKTALESIQMTIPSLPEQQKIADCLSALDERIAAQEAKIAALREHKKGLMQQLFPR